MLRGNGITKDDAVWAAADVAVIEQLLTRAVGLNETVYFARVPAEIERPAALDRLLGKPVALVPDWTKVHAATAAAGHFAGIVGPEVAPVLRAFRDRMTEEFTKLSTSVQARRAQAHQRLEAVGAAGLVTSTGSAAEPPQVPEPLRTEITRAQTDAKAHGAASITARVEGGIRAAAGTVAALEPHCAETERLLAAEAARDEALCEELGSKLWRAAVPTAASLPDVAQFRRELERLRQAAVATVSQPLGQLVAQMTEESVALLRLDRPVAELDRLLPLPAHVGGDTTSGLGQQQAALRARLTRLLSELDTVEEAERQFLRQVPTQIASPLFAAELCAAADLEERERLTTAKEIAFIDSFSAVSDFAKTRDEIVGSVQSIATELTASQKTDPALAETRDIVNSLERALRLVKAVGLRLQELSVLASRLLEDANLLRQQAASFAKAREIEAAQHKAAIEAQIQSQLKALKARRQLEDLDRQEAELLRQQQQQQQYGGAAVPPQTGAGFDFLRAQPSTQQPQLQQQQQQAPQYGGSYGGPAVPPPSAGGFDFLRTQPTQQQQSGPTGYAPPTSVDPFLSGRAPQTQWQPMPGQNPYVPPHPQFAPAPYPTAGGMQLPYQPQYQR
jgi:hypothetical protein